jgi:hypothetical protein
VRRKATGGSRRLAVLNLGFGIADFEFGGLKNSRDSKGRTEGSKQAAGRSGGAGEMGK